MRFEHLVQVNDPLQPLLTEVSREQLWRGLVRRAERPEQFVLGLAGASVDERIEEEGGVRLARTLDFGSFRVRDRVRLVTGAACIVDVEPAAGYPASRLTIRIEEPVPGSLFLRFTYEAEDGGGDEGSITSGLRQQAYRSADIDTVWRIRDLAERGEL
jgi:hypothetical protein